jgi:hypothetical protein
LSAYFFLYYLGFPRAYDYWKLGMMSRYTGRLESLLEVARFRALTAKEAQEFLKIERYLDPKAKASQNAARLLAEIKACL